jgi:hypothetical protein
LRALDKASGLLHQVRNFCVRLNAREFDGVIQVQGMGKLAARPEQGAIPDHR